MQVAQPGPAPLVPLTGETSHPTYNPSPSVDQFIHIHELDSNSMELDLQYSDEEKRILLDKQSAANPWYTNTHCLFMQLSICACFSVTYLVFCFVFSRHQFVENNLILKMGPVDKRKVSNCW